MRRYFPISLFFIGMLSACTTGELYYTKQSGERVLGCEVEFSGLPSVDVFAVEYALSLCAKNALKKGYVLDAEQEHLASLTTSIPLPQCGKSWDHTLAKSQYKKGTISKKQYGYIVAHIDLGLAKINQCSPDQTL